MKRTALVLACSLAIFTTACCGPGLEGAAEDAGADAGAGDVTGCPVPLAGGSPFGAALSGEHTYEAEGLTETRTDALDVWFPEGRRQGSPVLVSHPDPYGGLKVTRAMLDAQAGAPVSWSGRQGHEQLSFDGRLVGPDGGLQGQLYRDLAAPGSDVEVSAHATGWLCPSGAPPEAVLTTGGCAGPISTLGWSTDAPIDPQSVSVSPAGVRVVSGADDFSGRILVAPEAAFPPNTAPEVTVSAADVLGRTFAVEGSRVWLHTDDVVADLSFDAAPPAGAIDDCTGDAAVEDGALVLALDPTRGAVDALVALPDPDAAGGLRVDVTGSGCSVLELAVVGADGSATREYVDWTSGDPPPSVALALPAGRPLWLALRLTGGRAVPQSAPPQPCEARIEGLAFE